LITLSEYQELTFTKEDVQSLIAYLNTTPIDDYNLDGFQADLIIDALLYYEENYYSG
jgi:hypothetical protein